MLSRDLPSLQNALSCKLTAEMRNYNSPLSFPSNRFIHPGTRDFRFASKQVVKRDRECAFAWQVALNLHLHRTKSQQSCEFPKQILNFRSRILLLRQISKHFPISRLFTALGTSRRACSKWRTRTGRRITASRIWVSWPSVTHCLRRR